ncbi:MAG: riboflavin kinase [bacterium]|nr:riboflavin kinase [bacterium]
MAVFKAKVIKGTGRGRRLGFPTANLDKFDLKLSHGVYLIEAELSGKTYRGLMHFGPRKTFEGKVTVEAYLDDFKHNAYGKTLAVKVIRRIRTIKKFKTAEELRQQIEKDLKELDKS